jgi:polysaccharide export outer membrane protein
MGRRNQGARRAAWLVLGALAAAGTGCHFAPPADRCCAAPKFDPCCLPDLPVPRELNKVALPPYVVEAPDVLLIEALRVIPLPPYRVEPLDVLHLLGKNVYESDPINGAYPVAADGTIDLGRAYGGPLRVADLTPDEIQKVVQGKVRTFAKNAEVVVSLAQPRGARQIAGQHIVRPDGTVGLGGYGSVHVAGMTLEQAKAAIEAHLSRHLYRPEVAVDVHAFNSKRYYVITDCAGTGERVVPLPHTGNETVLDAVANAGGLTGGGDRTVWVARPAPTECGEDQILPVDWCGITRRGQVKTNYQILPGDRVYVLSRPRGRLDGATATANDRVRRVFNCMLYGRACDVIGSGSGSGEGGSDAAGPIGP